MKVKDLSKVLLTGSNRILIRDDSFHTGLRVVTSFTDFEELTKIILNAEVAFIYPQSNAACDIEIR